jgi:hypothetical protein
MKITPSSNMDYAPFYNMTIIRTKKSFSKTRQMAYITIIYDIVFHMDWKINFILFLFILFYIQHYFILITINLT